MSRFLRNFEGSKLRQFLMKKRVYAFKWCIQRLLDYEVFRFLYRQPSLKGEGGWSGKNLKSKGCLRCRAWRTIYIQYQSIIRKKTVCFFFEFSFFFLDFRFFWIIFDFFEQMYEIYFRVIYPSTLATVEMRVSPCQGYSRLVSRIRYNTNQYSIAVSENENHVGKNSFRNSKDLKKNSPNFTEVGRIFENVTQYFHPIFGETLKSHRN